jgi:sigma-B regulation protein RsbU (phosphoserine phosphatase)
MTSGEPESPATKAGPPESFESFLETSRVGYVYADPDGKITCVNARFAKWLNIEADALIGSSISDHLPVSGKVYFQTHLAPLLKMQGHFDEVALELAPVGGVRIPVLVSGIEHVDEAGTPQFIRLAFLPSIERRKYERNLVLAKTSATADAIRLRQLNAELDGKISEERETAALREQFIAVLGHDLRNPLAAIDGALRLIRKTPLNERATTIAEMVQMSMARMASLIDDVMDLARGRLGGGLELKKSMADLAPVLEHAVQELRITWPGREIQTSFVLPNPIPCDAKRLAQLLSNLLANAITHGASDGAIVIRAFEDGENFELSISNKGEPIPPAALDRLFQPFTREDVRPSQQGLGLGLYIASQIASAHQGTLTVDSSTAETRFTLRFPVTSSK